LKNYFEEVLAGETVFITLVAWLWRQCFGLAWRSGWECCEVGTAENYI